MLEPPAEPPAEPAAGVLEETGKESLPESCQPSEPSEHSEAESEGRQGQEGLGQGGSERPGPGMDMEGEEEMPLDPEEFVEAPTSCAKASKGSELMVSDRCPNRRIRLHSSAQMCQAAAVELVHVQADIFPSCSRISRIDPGVFTRSRRQARAEPCGT